MPLDFPLKKITALTTIFLILNGCVGVRVEVPEPVNPRLVNKDVTTRAWCGVSLWAVIAPIPLKLPVCKLYEGQKLTTPFYACGPFMLLGPIVHGYEGNMLCGKFQK
ncbi:hypothetical protein D3C86_1614440 [compost metagenome]